MAKTLNISRQMAATVARVNYGPKGYGFKPGVPIPRVGLGKTPALAGLFRAGRVVGISQINAMATNVLRGSG